MADLQSLSDREVELLKLLATGKSNKEIARELDISTNTVKVHVRNIFGKLDVASRTEASMAAVRMGLIETGPTEQTEQIEPPGPPAETPDPVFGTSPAYEAAVLPVPEPRSGPNTQTWILAGILVSLTLLSAIAVRLFYPTVEAAATQSADPVAIESQWKEQPRLPEPRTHAAAVAFEGAVYLIGGLIDGTPTGAGTRLDPEVGEWTPLAPKPTPASEIQAAVLGGLIYIPGGRLASGELSDALEIYDPRLDSWSAGPSLPGGVSAYALTAYEGELYLFGGRLGEGFTDRVLSFDPDTGEWSERTPLPAALGHAGSAAIGSRIYIFGGFDGETASTATLVYSPALEGTSSAWETAAPMPEGRYGMGVVGIADEIHLIGGTGGTEGHFTQMDFTPQTDLWQVLENPLGEQWSFAASAALGTQIYVLGGELEGEPTDRSLSYQVLFVVMFPVAPSE